jgi:biopolymer transport protein ExbD
MRIRTEVKIYDDVNLTPLMDLAWNLLIVFVIMATATVQGISVDLPKASASPSLAKASTRAVTVTADGRLYLDTQLVSIGELEEKLRREKAIRPDLPVVVKGDARVQYDKVIQVLDVMKRLQIVRLGLVTQRLVK